MERKILHVDVNNAFLSWTAVWMLKNGYDIERDYTNPLFMQDLENLYNINHNANREAVKKAIQKIQDIDTGSLEEKNDKFMDYLQNGICNLS